MRQIGVSFDYYFHDAKTIIAYLYDNGAVQRAYRYYQDRRSWSAGADARRRRGVPVCGSVGTAALRVPEIDGDGMVPAGEMCSDVLK